MNGSLVSKLEEVQARYEALGNRLGDPDLISDQKEFQRVAKEHSRLTPLMERFQEYRRVQQQLAGVRQMLAEESDAELRRMAAEEQDQLAEAEDRLRGQIQLLLLPRDPNDDRNVIMEIRAGAGGEEAALFAGVLLRMYSRLAERLGWRLEVLNASPTDLGGFKEVICQITGEAAYSRLKYESGVHRVQRVPETEAQGRIHTSTVTVAVLPEAEELDLQIDPGDLRVERMRSAGAGGQHVNKTESAIRLTHISTGIVVHCQDERSQGQNYERAMSILRSRLFDLMQSEAHAAEAAARRAQVGTGERSERIRTYNFPENRLSDHRIKLTLYRLDSLLEGDLNEVIDALVAHYQAERLRDSEEMH